MAKEREPINGSAVEAARQQELPEAHLLVMVEMFQALADPTRARIVYALTRQTLCVRDLALVVGISESGVSHHLRFLRDRRLVKFKRESTTLYYSVDDQHIAALFREANYHVDHVRHSLLDHPYTLPNHHEE